MRYVVILSLLLTTPAWGANTGPNGVDSQATQLNGTGILIGQAELDRSGKAGYDSANMSASNTVPAGVYCETQSGMAGPDFCILDEHATWVAQQIIGTGELGGVAPAAQLHSLGVATLTDESQFALSVNRLATLSGGLVKAINMSFYMTPNGLEDADGHSYTTRFVDWSARVHDVLYVVGWGHPDQDDVRKPEDNYNGITVAASEIVIGTGPYRRYSVNFNIQDFNTSDAQRIDLIAPGVDVPVLNWDETQGTQDGASFAAPTVVGTTALLQQYIDQQIAASNPRFGFFAYRHEVMKAVILNSADKLMNVHGSNREVLNGANQNWTQSPAYSSDFVALDPQMGAGHLNARRAVQQLSVGEYNPGTVARIGWDHHTIGGSGSINEYVFGQELSSGYIAATLVWDRLVDKTGGSTFQEGDQFFNDVLISDTNDLDLYLMPANSNDLNMAIAKSIGGDDTVEHIFFNIPNPGNYKLVVHNSSVTGLGDSGTYALAWWFGNFPILPGDYNGNGSVGQEDYDTWRTNFRNMVPAGTGADGNGDGTVDAADFVLWRKFADATGSGNSQVPEPNCVALLCLAGVLLFAERGMGVHMQRVAGMARGDYKMVRKALAC